MPSYQNQGDNAVTSGQENIDSQALEQNNGSMSSVANKNDDMSPGLNGQSIKHVTQPNETTQQSALMNGISDSRQINMNYPQDGSHMTNDLGQNGTTDNQLMGQVTYENLTQLENAQNNFVQQPIYQAKLDSSRSGNP